MKLLFRILWYLIVFVSIIIILPGNILLDIEPKELNDTLPDSFSPLKPNEVLSKTIKLFENKISGPESLAAFNGKFITGSNDGFLYQIDGNTIKPLFKLVEKSCASSPYNSTKCGRPLGLKFNSKGILYAVEPNVGVFAVENIFEKNVHAKLILNIDETSVLGKSSKLFNDLTIDEGVGQNGGDVLYISDMSTKFDLSQFPFMYFGSDEGRVLKYDINSKRVEAIAENLLMPNGVQLTDDRNAILVNEFAMRRVLKIHIKGPKKGQSEVLVANIAGEPDNIRRSASTKETYWLGIISPRTKSLENKLDFYMKRPILRKIICRLLHLIGSVIEFLGNTFNYSLAKEYGYDMKNGKHLSSIIMNDPNNKYAMIIEFDINGQIINSFQAMDPTLSSISEVNEVKVNEKESILYLGSYLNNYVGQLRINR